MIKTKNPQTRKTNALFTPDREYSIWLVPTGKVHLQLRKQIEALSKKHGAPYFEPHVTLVGLGAIPPKSCQELEDRVARLAKALHPLTIRLREIGRLDTFFRSLFLKVEPTPEVMRVGEMGRQLYKEIHHREPDDPVFFPHLSLLYGTMTNEEKQSIISTELSGLGVRDVQRRFNITFEASRLELRDTTTQDTRNWRLLKEFPLALAFAQGTLEKSL